MDKILKLITIIFIFGLMLLTGCKKETTTTTTDKQYYYDPKVPFGTINLISTKIQNVQNLKADVSILKKIKLTWTVPPLYTTLTYKVMIYKKKSPAADFDIKCPADTSAVASFCPADEANVAQFYVVPQIPDGVQANVFLDENSLDSTGAEIANVETDTPYSYWVFVQVNGKDWSSGVRLDVRSKKEGSTFKLPEPSKFWEYKKNSYGYVAVNNIPFLQSMNAGNPAIGLPVGGIGFGASGNIMYYADTGNNRVVIYSRDGALSCEDYTDEYEKQACLYQYISAPLTARNVLGQINDSKVAPCGPDNTLPASECLTAPTKVTILNKKLYISDSGNDRIVIYNHLPTNGCMQDNGSGVIYPRDCTPSAVIGKAGLLDISTPYSFATNGQRTLNYPTDLAEYDGSLYIADTGNNRVVRIANYANSDYFTCTSDTWGSFLCEFTAVLGQPTFFSKTSFADLVSQTPSIIDPVGIGDHLNPDLDKKYLLRKYFRSPTRIKFTSNGKMLVGSNEKFSIDNNLNYKSAMYGRIMVFDQDVINGPKESLLCNEATFDNVGGTDETKYNVQNLRPGGPCSAEKIIGQEKYDRIFVISAGTLSESTYDANQGAQYSIDDFDIINVPGPNQGDPIKQVLMTINSFNNQVSFWNDWANPVTVDAGYPRDSFAVDPVGTVHPVTGTLLPDLQSICAIRIIEDTSNIYINDCGGHKIYEIQAQDFAL